MATLLKKLLGDSPALVAFDLDGTLVDSVPDIALAVDQMLERLSMPVAGVDKVRDWVGNGAELLVRRALANSYDPDRVAEVSETLFAKAFPIFKEQYQATNGQVTQLYPGVLDCLSALHEMNIPMAVVTNKPKEFTDPLLVTVGVDQYFSQVIGGECFPERKPSPMALNHLLDVYNVEPSSCLMVGDSKHDVAAGQAAGFQVLAVSYGYNHGEPIEASQPDCIVDSLAQLIQVQEP